MQAGGAGAVDVAIHPPVRRHTGRSQKIDKIPPSFPGEAMATCGAPGPGVTRRNGPRRGRSPGKPGPGDPPPPHGAGSAARPSACRPPRSLWRRLPLLPWRLADSSWRGGVAGAARATPGPAAYDVPHRSDTEAAVFDGAPAVDFSKHRSEPRVGDAVLEGSLFAFVSNADVYDSVLSTMRDELFGSFAGPRPGFLAVPRMGGGRHAGGRCGSDSVCGPASDRLRVRAGQSQSSGAPISFVLR
jgi:hypothetical protein